VPGVLGVIHSPFRGKSTTTGVSMRESLEAFERRMRWNVLNVGCVGTFAPFASLRAGCPNV
jgi:hypothetical protein